MYLLKILTIILLLLFPFGETLRFDVGNNIAVRPIDIVVCLIAVIWISLNSKKKKLRDLHWQFFAFPLIGLIALVVNAGWLKPIEFGVSFIYLLRWVSYLVIFPALSVVSDSFKKTLTNLMLLDGFLIIALGFLQYFFYPTLRNLYYLGWDDHMYRLYSVFFDPNFAGAFLVLFFIFAAGILYTDLQRKSYLKSIFLSVIMAITLLAIFLTFSRSALLMLVAASAVFLFLIKRKRLFFALLAAITLYILVISPRFYVISMNLFRTASTDARFYNYSSAVKIIAYRPLLGVGFNSYRYAKKKYGIREGWAPTPSHADAGVDNSFLFILATTGITGLIAYLSLYYAILKKAYNLYSKHASIMAVVVISSLSALFVDSLFINSLFFPEIMLWVWLIVGLTENKIL